ncbi:ribose-5-phosphate isomerase RpiA [Paenibacillus sp. sgz302251]|uniref:ribose-5-phosphate isomerase RpiA n=1 Tax=Paenibacillus sp. sgz302251 TaxID=3414493 RepID=UPI003C7D501A
MIALESKRIAAEHAVAYIADGMTVGLGTGSTAYWAIKKLGERIQEGLQIRAIATSKKSEQLASEYGIPIITFGEITGEVDITIDGADEVDKNWNLIKGGGGALLREKIVASASKVMIVVVDQRKIVDHLGLFPLPVEIVKFGFESTIQKLSQLGCTPALRIVDEKPFMTDNQNYIVDCKFDWIEDPKQLSYLINQIPGVVDHGLFIQMAHKVVIGYDDGSVKELGNKGK